MFADADCEESSCESMKSDNWSVFWNDYDEEEEKKEEEELHAPYV